MTPKEEPSLLIARVRGLLLDQPSTREISMFGGRSFMVDDWMIASARANGDLLVRVDPARHEELIRRPGASPAEMGAGRRMGEGWVSIDAATIRSDDGLSFWIDAALANDQRAQGGAADPQSGGQAAVAKRSRNAASA